MKRFFYDLETTGLYPGKHGIHQIAGLIEIDGEVVEGFNFKVKPNPLAEISPDALDASNVTVDQINSYEDMLSVFIKLKSILSKYVDPFNKQDKFFLVGFNNRKFDDDFLRGFFLQNGDNYFGSWFWSDSHDILVLASYFLRNKRTKMENFKLKTVAKYIGLEVDETKLHDAMYDIYLTRGIELNLLKITYE